jgi:hypothetical protein
MICIKRFVTALIISCFAITTASATDIITNTYQAIENKTTHTHLDTVYDSFQSYFGTVENNTITIEKPYDNSSYRLNKKMILLVNYINTTDSIIHLKYYSTLYKYKNAGEVDSIISNKIFVKKSNFISCNQQFFEVSILPKHTLHTYLVYHTYRIQRLFNTKKQCIFRYTDIV